jgi:hypothetical protein
MYPFRQQALRAFPNFPVQVIDTWFEHVAEAGWPPIVDTSGIARGVWYSRIFRDRPIAFWRAVSWALEHRQLTLSDLEPESLTTVAQLSGAFAMGLPHPPNIPVRDASQRIRGFVKVLQDTGHLPLPPVLLATREGLEVLDGNHRVAAFVYAQEAGLSIESVQSFWVARSPISGLKGLAC